MNDQSLKLAIYLFENMPIPSYEELESNGEIYLTDILEQTGIDIDSFTKVYLKHRTKYNSFRSEFLAEYVPLSIPTLKELIQDEINHDPECDFVSTGALSRKNLPLETLEYIFDISFGKPREEWDTMLAFALLKHPACTPIFKEKLFKNRLNLETKWKYYLEDDAKNDPKSKQFYERSGSGTTGGGGVFG